MYVEFPSSFLRRGLEFVDTPGIGSAIEANTATTLEFIPRCDVVLFVTSADGSMAAVEMDFLERIRRHVSKVFFVVNKMDLMAPGERETLFRFIENNLSQRIKIPRVKLYPVSARLALAAKEDQNRSRLVESGLPVLENALAEFLAERKSATFLTTILERIDSLLMTVRHPEATRRRTTVQQMRERVRTGQSASILPSEAASYAPRPQMAAPAVVTPLKAAKASDLIAGMRTRGCSVCDHLGKVLFDFLSQWQYALSCEETAQRIFAEQQGFCVPHTWQLTAFSSPRGMSVGYPTMVESLSARLSTLAAKMESIHDAAERIAGLPGRPATCRACRLLADAESDYVRRLADMILTPRGRLDYSRSQGACMRHLSPCRRHPRCRYYPLSARRDHKAV